MSRRLVRALGATTVLVFLLAAFTPAVHLLGSWFIPDRPAEHAQAIVVLGAGGVAPAAT